MTTVGYIGMYILGWGIGYPTRTGTRTEPDPNGFGSGRVGHFRGRGFSVQYPFTLVKLEPKYLILDSLFFPFSLYFKNFQSTKKEKKMNNKIRATTANSASLSLSHYGWFGIFSYKKSYSVNIYYR